MRALVVGLVLVGLGVVGPGCTEDKCKNPKRITDPNTGIEGSAINCNTVMVCSHGGRVTRKRVDDEKLQAIVDRGTDGANEERCKRLAKASLIDELKYSNCEVEVSPQPLCIDAQGLPSGSGPSGTTGGTLVTVGVGAGSGDYYFQFDGEGGAGGSSANPESGEGGSGGI